jgi:AcrR family transcriptional regulator
MPARATESAPGLRERIVDAAFEVIHEQGMARARTSSIAEAAGCAEGSIYRYFSGKPQLLEEVVRSRLANVSDLLGALPGSAGTATVRTNLVAVSQSVSAFYAEVLPLAAGVLADARLRSRQRHLFGEGGLDVGACVADALADYLRAERDLGRVRPDVDADAAACLLISSCLGTSLLTALTRRDPGPAQVVDALIAGLEPASGERGAT